MDSPCRGAPQHGLMLPVSNEFPDLRVQYQGGGYPEQFNKDGSHDLTRVARFETYNGFLFGSLNPDVQPLKDYLGETTKLIDMVVNQSEAGLEVLRGASTYTYDGNWKLQAENGADGYHVSSVHWNYVATTGRRGQEGKEDKIKANDASKWSKQKRSSALHCLSSSPR